MYNIHMESIRIPTLETPKVPIASEEIEKFGIGHMPTDTQFSVDNIHPSEKGEIIETYASTLKHIKSLLGNITTIIEQANTENRSSEVFSNLVAGIENALYKTANQILYHSSLNPIESLTAFDELNMILIAVTDTLISPDITKKRIYPKTFIYDLQIPKDTQSFTVTSFNALFSKDHIAFNITSTPEYQDTEKSIKSGLRLDYGPLYRETENGTIDKTKTSWITSVDISGFYIDRIMNKYSPRGHHFTNIFDYKMNLLIQGLAEKLKQHFDN